jgi:hypothetical protein
MTEPPDFSNTYLDFSEFHPLDHFIAGPRCVMLTPTGWASVKYHGHLAWILGWRAEFRRLTYCKITKHEFTDGSCINCRAEEGSR